MSKLETLLLWRLVKATRADSAFDGEGAFRFGGRWNSRSHRIVCASSTLSLALLEILVHLDPAAHVPDLVALSIRVPRTDIETFKTPTADKATTLTGELRQTRTWGDRWIKEANSPALRVPSSIVPMESNFLINPQHPKFNKYTISAPLPFPIDNRYCPIKAANKTL
jgi:RES domain-containing protein